jgi:general stress protein 26
MTLRPGDVGKVERVARLKQDAEAAHQHWTNEYKEAFDEGKLPPAFTGLSLKNHIMVGRRHDYLSFLLWKIISQ